MVAQVLARQQATPCVRQRTSVGKRRRGSYCPKFGAWPPFARGRAHFQGGDGGVHGKKATVAYYYGNLLFTGFLLNLTRI